LIFYELVSMDNLLGLPPPSMDWNASDAATQFVEFKRTCELYLEGPLGDLTEERKVKYLLIWAGKEGRELAETWDLSGGDKKKLSKYWDKFQQHVKPKKNFRLARYKLRQCVQAPTELVDGFIRRVRTLAAECEYTDTNEQIVDALVFGTNSTDVQKRLLQKDNTLTVE
jgi:hypothetical protein